LRQHGAADLDARCDFRQFESFRHAPKDAPLGHIEHGLTPFCSQRSIESDLLDSFDEFILRTFRDDIQAPALDQHFEATGRERSGEYHATGVLTDVDEAAGARQSRPEAADVHVAAAADLRPAAAGESQAAPTVEAELL